MKALTLWQPWASYIAVGMKRFETRSWAVSYRGPIAIHASARKLGPYERELAAYHTFLPNDLPLPFGAVVATAELVDVFRMGEHTFRGVDEREVDLGDWTAGRFAWALVNVVRFPEPIPAKGAQGLWEWVRP